MEDAKLALNDSTAQLRDEEQTCYKKCMSATGDVVICFKDRRQINNNCACKLKKKHMGL